MKFLLLVLFTVTILNAQNIEGEILDAETSEPIEYVNVFVKEQKIGGVSDSRGKFKIVTNQKIAPSQAVFFTILGYHPVSYSIADLKKRNFTIYLNKSTEVLNEVTMSGNRKRKPNIAYTKLAPLIKGVYNFGSEIINGKIYVIGGDKTFFENEFRTATMNSTNEAEFSRKLKPNHNWKNHSDALQIYDIPNGTWEESDLKFRKRAYHRVTSIDNQLYILGGKRLGLNRKYEYLDDKIEVLDIAANNIVIDDVNPHQALNFATFSHQDNIILMGGSIKRELEGPKTFTNKSHVFNTKTGYWYELPKMTKAKETNGVIIKDKIYLIGGFNRKALNEIESFDLISGAWEIEGKLPYGIENPSVTFNNNIIYIYNIGKIFTFNIRTKSLSEFNIELNFSDASIHYYQDKLYLLGGMVKEDFQITSSKNLYSIDLSEFNTTEFTNAPSK